MVTLFGTETCSRKDPQKTTYQPNYVPYRAVSEGLWRSKDDKVALYANLREKEPKETHDIKQDRYKLLIGDRGSCWKACESQRFV